MLGRVKGTVTLDYTHVAEPLDADAIYGDISNCFVMNQQPDAIELWEHQWDWLTKPHRMRVCREDYLICRDQDAVGSNELWGIPVKLRAS